MKVLFSFFLVVHLILIAESLDVRPKVTLSHGGELEGVTQTTLGKRSVSVFLGIPYGTADRFKDPEPAAPWNGVKDAGTPSPLCLQYNLLNPSNPVTGVENCLFLNVITPRLFNASLELLPVVFLIPAGSFTSFGASVYGGRFLLDKDVVYVSVNSRVGILGYLSTEDEVIPGNWGLKDQALALRWVQENIKQFGGDPNSVTLVGESSGACSVHLHYFSQLSRGLFHRGVALSGSAGNYWALAAIPGQKARQLATSLYCSDTSSSSQILNCLSTADGQTLTANYAHFDNYGNSPFAPVIEKVSVKGAFLTESPISLISKGEAANLPLIMSTVQGEGLLPGAEFIADQDSLIALDSGWTKVAPLLLDYKDSVITGKEEIVTNKIRERYFGAGNLTDNLPQLIQLLGDRSIVGDAVYTALLQAKHSSAAVYALLFNYFGSANSGQLLGATLDQLKPYGPAHGDDVAYLFNTTYLTTANTQQDVDVIQSFVNMITSFASTGKPVFNEKIDWNSVSKRGLETNTLNYLKFDSVTELKMESAKNLGNFEFWQSLPLNEPAAKRSV